MPVAITPKQESVLKTTKEALSPKVPQQEAPPEALKVDFKMDEGLDLDTFQPEQLPVQETKEVKQEKALTPDKVAEKEVVEPVKQETQPKVEEIEEEVQKIDEENERKEEKKEEETSISKFLKPPVKKQEEKVLGTVPEKSAEVVKKIDPTKGASRDYTGFSPEEQSVLKQMSNDAFSFASRVIKENKELSKLREFSLFQHEQGYVLDPAYQKTQDEASQWDEQARYWQGQLVGLDKGQSVKPFHGWDAQGKAIFGAEIPASKAVEEQVRMQMMKCSQNAEQLRGQLQTYPARYKQQYQNDLEAIQNERKQRFAWVADPKLMDYTVNIEGQGDMSIRQVKEQFAGLFPPYLRSHPALDVASDLFVALRIQSSELAEAKNGKQVEQTIEKEQERVEPTSQERPAKEGKKVHGVTEFRALPDGF